MGADETLDRRIVRLQQELVDEIEVELGREALEELVYCRFVEPHEGRRPSYGAVILSGERASDLVPPLASPAAFIDANAPLDVLRRFADGRTSFVIRGPGRVPALVVDPAWTGSESELAMYASGADATVVQRLASGQLRLYCGDRVFFEDGGIWLAQPNARAAYESVSSLLDPEHSSTAHAILDMCVDTLSPAGHGATLIWFPDGADEASAYLDASVAISPPGLSAADSAHAPAIAHALGQLDRAAVIEADGRITSLNVTLTHDEAAAQLNFDGGTRHTSAGRYSATVGDAIVFVVSADGPVTVFQGGDVIASVP